MTARLVFLGTLWVVLSLSLWGRAQVAIDDRDIRLDDGGTLEHLLASHVIANPAEVGSWTAGIQEAVNRCNGATGLCIVELRCNTTYTLAARNTWDDASAINLSGRPNLWLRGCGPRSIVLYSQASTVGNSAQLIRADNVAGLKLSDFALTWNETCTASCSTGTNGAFYATRTTDLELTRMTFSAPEQTGDPDTAAINMQLVYLEPDTSTNPDSMNVGARITNNTVHASSRGFTLTGCDYCVIANNHIDFTGHANGSAPANTAAITIKYGIGNVISGNTIDLAENGDTGSGDMSGIFLAPQGSFSDPNSAGEGVAITGNTFVGLRRPGQIGIEVNGYLGASILGNSISAGSCANSSTLSCYNGEDCVSVGGACIAAFVDGIRFSPNSSDNSGWNRRSLIVGNIFRNFNDNESNCPFNFVTGGGTDVTENLANLIQNNVLFLSDPTDDGLCGDAGDIAGNYIAANQIIGKTTRCLEGEDQTSCGVQYDRASKSLRTFVEQLAKTGTGSLIAEECRGATIANTGAAGAIVLTLPQAAAGLRCVFFLTVAQDLDVNPLGSDRILALTNANGDAISSDLAIGSWIEMEGINATQWMPLGRGGVWTDVN